MMFPARATIRVQFALMAGLLATTAAAQSTSQSNTQIVTSGNCTVNIVRSSARDVRVSDCGEQSARAALLERTINGIFANQSVQISRIDDMIAAMNNFISETSQDQAALIDATAVANDKLDRIIDFLNSFQEKPEDAAGLIPLLSDGSLSHIQERKPFGIQLVRIVRSENNQVRVVMRLVPSGPENFDIALRMEKIGHDLSPSSGTRIEDWNIIGLYGTTCTLYQIPNVTPLATHFDLSKIDQAVVQKQSTTQKLPVTLIVSASCSGRVIGEDLTLNMRFHFRPTAGAPDSWSPVDYRFDATNITELIPVETSQ